MSSSSAIFSGSSRFSTDFQQVVTRSVQIASLPMTQLNADKTLITNKESAYTSIGSKFSAIQSAMDRLVSVAKSSYSASSSDTTIATVSTATGASDGTFSVQVTKAGSYSQYLSLDTDAKVTDPAKSNLATGTTFTLTIDGVDTPLTVADSSLSGLALAINQAAAGAQASIVNLGSPDSPNYVLSVKGTRWAKEDITLKSGNGTTLLGWLSDGQNAEYTVNGLPSTPIKTSNPSVTVAPGVTATLQPKTGSTTVSVARDSSALSSALSAFATAYNAAVTELNKHHGENAGVLRGDSQLATLAGQLRNIVNYQDGQGVNTLGLQFDQNGVLSIDTARFSKQSSDAISAFLGDGTSSGFLKNATDTLKNVQDGILTSAQSTLSEAAKRKDNQIADTQNRIDQLQTNLNAKMAAADALVASLEQNVSYFTSMFAQQQTNASAYK